MSAAKCANQPKCSVASSGLLLTTATLRRRPITPRDVFEWHALIRYGVISGPSGTLLKHEAVEMSGSEPIYCCPAVEPCAHIRRHALLARKTDEHWNEAVIAIAVHRWRKPNHRHAHTTRRD